jgi:peptidoglycan/LPS O-acetylase OafA/YrhL
MTLSMQHHTLASKPHYPILDGLRGVAAVMVVIFHTLEPLSTSHLDLMMNHGYLAVDFFFLLSGYVIGYAYDDRWDKMTIWGFFKRRLIRLQPMIIIGMIVGAIFFYFQDSPNWPLIHTVPVSKLLLVMAIGCTLIPVPISMDIRGWQEMHPLDGPGWSLFFEYVANILYALFVRRFSKTMLSILVIICGIALIQYTVTSQTGDVIGGWSLDPLQLRIGFTRMMYPFFAGLLLRRVAKAGDIKNAFFWCTLLLIVFFSMPRVGGAKNLWMNGLYESLTIIFIFPLIVYIGASGKLIGKFATKSCSFLGAISYPLYITHYPLVYTYWAWISRNKVTTLQQAIPWAAVVWVSAITLAYFYLKFYDEPVRRWLTKRFGNA